MNQDLTAPSQSRSPSDDRVLEQIRKRQLDWIFFAVAILGAPSFALSIYENARNGYWIVVAVVVIIYLAAVVGAVFRRRLTNRVRAHILMTGGFVFTMAMFVFFGHAGVGTWTLLTTVVLTTMLDGRRTGLLLLAECLVGLVVIGTFYCVGILPLTGGQGVQPPMENPAPDSVATWLIIGIGLTTVSLLMVFVRVPFSAGSPKPWLILGNKKTRCGN